MQHRTISYHFLEIDGFALLGMAELADPVGKKKFNQKKFHNESFTLSLRGGRQRRCNVWSEAARRSSRGLTGSI